MSVKYQEQNIVGLNNNIDDGAPSTNKLYSSEYVQSRFDYIEQQIQALILAAKGVRDVVGSKAELDNYNTDLLVIGDIINVLADETRGNANTYYRWDGQLPFTYIGDIASYYTKVEFNGLIDEKQYLLESGQNIKTINGESVLGSGDIVLPVNLDDYYPVGYIYISIMDNDPNVMFGGTWEKIEKRSIYGADDNDVVGSAGGFEKVTLTNEQLPEHTHTASAHSHSISLSGGLANSARASISGNANGVPLCRSVTSIHSDGQYDDIRLYKGSDYRLYEDVDWIITRNANNNTVNGTITCDSATPSIESTGGSGAHNNMPPYRAVNIWKRTA